MEVEPSLQHLPLVEDVRWLDSSCILKLSDAHFRFLLWRSSTIVGLFAFRGSTLHPYGLGRLALEMGR